MMRTLFLQGPSFDGFDGGAVLHDFERGVVSALPMQLERDQDPR